MKRNLQNKTLQYIVVSGGKQIQFSNAYERFSVCKKAIMQ